MIDTKNFRKEEFDCPCCGENEMVQSFVVILQRIRDEVGVPMVITSGYRCVKHNAEIGGTPNSAHTRGLAADIACKPGNSSFRYKLITAAIMNGIRRIGVARSYIHLDYDPGLPQNHIWIYNA